MKLIPNDDARVIKVYTDGLPFTVAVDDDVITLSGPGVEYALRYFTFGGSTSPARDADVEVQP